MDLFKCISSLPKLNKVKVDSLNRLGIYKIKDLLFYRPYNILFWKKFPKLKEIQNNDLVILDVVIDEVQITKKPSHKNPARIRCLTQDFFIFLIYFNPIPPFIYNLLKTSKKYIISGKVQTYMNQIYINHPDFIFGEVSDKEPIYHLTYGLVNKQVISFVKEALGDIEYIHIPEWISDNILKEANFPSFKEALIKLHNPHSYKDLSEESSHIKRLAYDEILAHNLALKINKAESNQKQGRKFNLNKDLQNQVLQYIGFTLTEAQKKVIAEIEKNQENPTRMIRMLQGDVGAGKTLVALIAILNVVKQAQSVLMAPTDLLATQHFEFFCTSLEATDIKVELLTGKITGKARSEILAKLEAGEIDILIGTHALFQERIKFKDLGLIIIDEQHRFGVVQRLKLVEKGENPDVLIMTATPIPRTLSLALYNDLDVSILDAKPLGRLPIKTSSMPLSKITELTNSLLKADQKIYWVCPLIEGEENYLNNITERHKYLLQFFPGQVGVLHGKMKPSEKSDIMGEFKDGNMKILVATTVIEVGINVPEATIMVIENAENFGLSQLHQLRGRVGRSNVQSYCILLYGPRLSEQAKERIAIMKKSNDGFYIAEADLNLRGAGEILGSKQSGDPDFKFFNFYHHMNLAKTANQEIDKIFSMEPKFKLLLKFFDYETNLDRF